MAVLTFGGYVVGARRAFGYDAAVTMYNFVTGSTGDVFTRQVVYNNHPLFSFVEHLVWVVTGSADESIMRIAPALFAAAAAGILTWRVAGHWGVVSGLAGGLVLATHPLLTSERDVRGYTLAVLAIVVMGVAVLDVKSPALFAVSLAVGIGTHIYVAVAGVALVAVLWQQKELIRVWRLTAGFGVVAGLACYVGLADQMGRSNEVRLFRPSFPLHAGWELLGGNALAAIALALLLVFAATPRPSATALYLSAACHLESWGGGYWLRKTCTRGSSTSPYPQWPWVSAPRLDATRGTPSWPLSRQLPCSSPLLAVGRRTSYRTSN